MRSGLLILALFVPGALRAETPAPVAPSRVRIVRSSATSQPRLDVSIVNGSFFAALEALELHLGRPIGTTFTKDFFINYEAKGRTAREVLQALVVKSGLVLIDRKDHFMVMTLGGPLVTLDVKDEDVGVILKSMKKQCGIKNLLIDADVSGKGTYLLRDVPCSTAFKIVFASFGLAAEMETSSVMLVGKRK